MRIFHNKSILFFFVLLFVSALIIFVPKLQAQEMPVTDNAISSETSMFEQMLQIVTKTEAYQFTAQIEQLLIPRAVPHNIGATEERIDSQLTAVVHSPTSTQLELRFEGNGIPPIHMEQQDGYTYLIKDGERTLIENPLSTTASDGTFMGYLHAATNITQKENPAFPQYTIYQFDIDGQKYVDYVAESIRAQLPPERQNQILAPMAGAELLSGQGEIWVDANGYPQRQILDIQMPEINESFDSSSHIVINYQFDHTNTQMSLPTSQEQRPLLANNSQNNALPQTQLPSTTTKALLTHAQLAQIGLSLLFLLLTIALLFANRRLQLPLAIFLAFVLATQTTWQSFAYAHMSNISRAKSLSEALGLEQQEDLTALVDETPQAPTAPQVTQTSETCGTGDLVTDTDQDGTTDYVEWCLGTNPYDPDTDGDLITDTLEINGFVFTDTFGTAHTFYSDPLNEDSNNDGLDDNAEWLAPIGIAPEHDPDGDNIPNLWDFDNDGDGVNDNLDLDPYDFTLEYKYSFHIGTTVEQDPLDGYQYIEFQVQPKDTSHLRYTLSSLDWPYDEEGNIQDLDNSRDDITFTPFLKAATKQVPSQELLDLYGINAFNTDETYEDYELYVPLTPVGEGGQINAFAGKVAYELSGLTAVEWTSTQLVWVANMAYDEQVGDDIQTEVAPLHEYIDKYRFTGLEVTTNNNFDYMLLGTPNSPTDTRDLFQLMMGLEVLYLQSVNPNLDTLESRFTNNNTPLTQTLGIPASDIAVSRPDQPAGHMDGLPGSIVERIPAFLNNQSYPQNDMASLIIAIEGEMGSASIEDARTSSNSRLVFNLTDIPKATMRSLAMQHFEYDVTTWVSADDDLVLETFEARYNDLDTILTSLQTTYPDVDEADLIMVLAGFLSVWSTTMSNMIYFDGLQLVPTELNETTLTEQISADSATDSISYLIEAANIGVIGEGLIFDDSSNYFTYLMRSKFIDNNVSDVAYVQISVSQFVLSAYFTYYYLKIVRNFRGTSKWSTLYESVYYSKLDRYTAKGAKANSKIASLGAYADDAGNFVRVKPKILTRIAKFVGKHAKKLAKLGTIMKGVLDVVFLAVEVTLIWLSYVNFHSIYGYEKDFALAYAIVATVVAVVFAVLSVFPAGLVLVLALDLAFLLIDLLARAMGIKGFSSQEFFISQITELFVKFDPYTRIRDFDFDGLEVKVDGPLIKDSKMVLADEFTGYIQRVRGSDYTELNKSTSYGYFEANASNGVSVSTSRTESNCVIGDYIDKSKREYDYWVLYEHTQTCRNDMQANYVFDNANINAEIEFIHKAELVTRYERCNGNFGALGNIDCDDKTSNTSMPNDLPDESKWDWSSIKVDIIPDKLSDLWTWNQLATNNSSYATYAYADPDADELSRSVEYQIGTSSALWDTDGDGLSDGFEVNEWDTAGTNPLQADSDGDGLTDGHEFMIGTSINDADSDDDGLTDGEEVFHWNGSEWTGGGWTVRINGTDYFVFSDPLNANADKDSLNDQSEIFGLEGQQLIGSSPDAYNGDVPQITFDAGSRFLSPNLSASIYAASGDVVTATFNILNVGISPITDTVSLCLPVGGLTSVTINATGDRVPTTQTNSNCYEWDFSSNPLLFLQEFNVDLSALGASGTLSGTIDLTVPYTSADGARTIQESVSFVLDNTAPEVNITDPISASILIGDYYVVGGVAYDDNSWIDHVELTVPAGTYTATGTSPWAYTWELPDQGVVDVTAVAYDLLGNASDPFTIQVIVDSLAPVITSNLPDGATISAGESYSTTFALNGTVTDNYSGLVRVQSRVNNQPWHTIWDTDTPQLSTTWSGSLELPAISQSTQGEHSLHLRAWDAYGNIGYASQTIFIDILPPTNELTDRRFSQETPQHVALNQPLTLTGVANDAGNNPLASGPIPIEGTLNSIEDATIWFQQDDYDDDDLGITVSWIGDFNGDRLGDLAIGLPNALDGQGKVYVVGGKPGGWAIPNIGELESLNEYKPAFVGEIGAEIGSAIAPVGDFDGNGFEDFIIGDLTNNRLFLMYGSSSSMGNNQLLDGETNGRWAHLYANNETVTNRFYAAGDVNKDTLADLFVATDNAVYLLLGDPSPYPEQPLDQFAAAKMTVSDGAAMGVGDMTGDFIDDFVIATGGMVYLFAGHTGFVANAQTDLLTTQAIASFATSDALPTVVRAEDLNGDGLNDFAFTNGSNPTVVYGSDSGSFSTATLGGFPSALTGFLAGVGDTNKDGQGDLVVGNADGDAYLLLGGDLTNIASTIEGVADVAHAPYTLGADLAGDGSADLLVVPSASAASDLGYAQPVLQKPFLSSNFVASVNAPRNHNRTASLSPNRLAPAAPNAVPVAYWPLEDGTGTTATDTISGLNGTLTNGPVWSTETSPAFVTQNDYAVYFDGVDDSITVPNSTDINNGTFSQRTVSLWFKADEPFVTSRKQVLWEEGGATNGLNLYLYDGLLYAGSWNGSYGWSGAWITSTVITDTWYHATLIVDSTSTSGATADAMALYIGQELIGTAEATQLASHVDAIGIGNQTAATKFHDGIASSGTNTFVGYIDEVSIYNAVQYPADAVTVAPSGGDYTSIQAAIDSGAARVLIEPGIYYETITLASNVEVFGSGAGLTYIAMPAGSANPLVTIDGVSNADLANLTLQGDGSGVGVSAGNGASVIQLERLVIEGFGTAVSITDASTDVDLKNNTIVDNTDGLEATSCASVDVRNTIFAYNSGTALNYEACASIKRHEFNLYYANSTDLNPNDPGNGELFSNPLFLDYTAGDYRVALASPVIDAGAPGDAVPPGAGSFIDIGHLEQTGSSYVASHEYCATCDNDGLVWSIDAFDSIQDAVSAAENDLLNLFDGDGTQFTVGVDKGIYTESVTIQWNLQLVGSGPNQTTIQGVNAPAVTLSGTAGSKVIGFTLIGGGAEPVGAHITNGSNFIELGYNLFKANEIGVLVNGRSSGYAEFNTFISNTTAIETQQKWNWLDTNSNLISGNDEGLMALDGSVIFSEYNLLNNTINVTNVITGQFDILNQDPMLTGEYGYLTLGSPAIDEGNATADVPIGGGLLPDIGWHELTIAPISLFMGQADESIANESIGVGSVEYAIVSVASITSPVTSTLPSTWNLATLDSPDEKLTYWSTVYTPTTTGFYRFYSRATDSLGNTEIDETDWFDGSFYVDDTAPVVSHSSEYISGANSTRIKLTGVVNDYVDTSFDVEQIYFLIDGVRYDANWSLNGWEPDGSTPRTFHLIYVNDTGAVINADIQAVAVDGAGQVGMSTAVNTFINWDARYQRYKLDTVPPEVWYADLNDDYLPIPPYDEILYPVIYMNWNAEDKANANEWRTGINGYQISFDGGLTWETIEATNFGVPNGKTEEYEWHVPDGLDATTVPLKLRVTDFAGNSRTYVYPMTVDTEGPRMTGSILFNGAYETGYHTDGELDVTFSWRPPIDGSGVVQGYINAGANDGTVPPTFAWDEFTRDTTFRGPGIYGFTAGGEDEAGNPGFIYVGPWYGGQLTDFMLPWNGAIQSLDQTRDGNIETANREWLTDTEKLDIDTRPLTNQTLYATWDGTSTYFALDGGEWGYGTQQDGEMWLYYDFFDAQGTTQPVSYTGNITLPFNADWAVMFDGNSFLRWEYTGGSWQTDSRDYEYAYDASLGGIEAMVSAEQLTTNFDTHRLMAFSYKDSMAQSAFPLNNPLTGNFNNYYEWENIVQGVDLLSLPTGARLPSISMDVVSTPPEANTLTHNDVVTYVVTLANNEANIGTEVQLQLNGTTGINYQTITGATCEDCPSASSWLLAVPDLGAYSTHVVTVVAQLDADLTGLTFVTSTVQLITVGEEQSETAVDHLLDLDNPTVDISINPGNVIAIGTQSIAGSANDNLGVGVEVVEVSTDGVNWQTADGTVEWDATLDWDSGTFGPSAINQLYVRQLYVRASDYHGQMSHVTVITFTGDITAPVFLTTTVPNLVGNSSVAVLNGYATDPAPANAQIRDLEAQFDSPTANWQEGVINPLDSTATVQDWFYNWQLPREDGVAHTVRYRITDYGGNITYSDWYTTMVDTIAPVYTVTQQLTQVPISNTTTTLAGTISDGVGVASMRVLVYPETGLGYEVLANVDGSNWDMVLSAEMTGTYKLIIIAEDTIGNQRISDSYTIEVIDIASAPVVSIAINGNDAQLSWQANIANNCSYAVYRHTSPYFTPQPAYLLDGGLSESTGSYTALGDASSGNSYFYQVQASSCGGGTAVSNEVGLFTFGIVPGD